MPIDKPESVDYNIFKGQYVAMDKMNQFISKYKRGDLVYRSGDPLDSFFIMQKGKVQLKLAEDDFVVASLTKGDFFGEESLNEGQNANYSVESLEDVEVIKIPYPDLVDMMKKNSEISLKILKKLSEKNIKIEKVLLNRHPPSGKPPLEATKPDEQTTEKISPDIQAHIIIQRSTRVVQLTKTTTYLGRKDFTTGFVPDIDLTDEDEEKYISRKHGKIFLADGKFYFSEEPGAINGTFLNGNKLKTGVKYDLKDGDEMTLCHLNILFKL